MARFPLAELVGFNALFPLQRHFCKIAAVKRQQNYYSDYSENHMSFLRELDLCLHQSLFGAAFYTLHAEYTLCCVFSVSGIIGDIYLHGADLFAFLAAHAFFLIAFYPQQRKIACRL